MKIRHLHIENFKGLRSLDHDFTGSDGSPRNLTALIGDNGSGKTTALQAIALVLSMAARRTSSPDKLNWHGFLADRIGSLGKTQVELSIDFDEEEARTCRVLFEEWQQSLSAAEKQGKKLVPPSEAKNVQLTFQNGRLTSSSGAQAVNQFAGRYYIGKLARTRPWFRDDYVKLGSVFWFDQMRNLGQSLSSIKEDENQPVYAETWHSGVEQLRDFLVGWWAHHTSPERRGKDYIPELRTKFNLVFPGVNFAGVAPRGVEAGGVSDFYFLMEREGKVFDIAEMSSGEQAVFPLIYEFVRLSIAKSVVLIDELELHLHPPQQQALLAALRKLGPDCQFIVTTHSRFLEGSIPDEHEVRLPGGTTMPVNLLLVEGDLDQQLLNAVYGGAPTAEAAGSKSALALRVLDRRGKERKDMFYLRDRDYDTEPPEDIAKPTEEFRNRQHIGWCWCRHSIENYMLDPAIICPALHVAEKEYLPALISAALTIRFYQAARWTIGTVRCGLLPPYKLDTQEEKMEFYLPPWDGLDNNTSHRWVLAHVEAFAAEVRPSLDPRFVDDVYIRRAKRFENGFCNEPGNILNWFSGKNLMAALKDWWSGLGMAGPGDFRNHVRDWMLSHPEDVLNALPEWRALLDVMRSM